MKLETGESSLVADLAKVGEGGVDDDLNWEEILSKPRGETGRILQDVMGAFPGAVDAVRGAVTTDYQQEADAALFGRNLRVARKR